MNKANLVFLLPLPYFYLLKLLRIKQKTPVFTGALLVPRAGIEPALTEARWILSPLRLPISPPRHRSCDIHDNLH